ncbi:hypothetical protein D2E76_26360 [Mycobacteroides abscessus]|uniref:Transmembrane protein n=1 Tax=Mycobacteroides abscessus TaxID=36809 RepID=A0ABD7HHA6_9MYCO|nr:hypothetical protein D2E66_18190 [Mycobacteroides abscessus]RIT28900.1 hypothetical protein D2E76_26360 [Mycobacteroides abscessus]
MKSNPRVPVVLIAVGSVLMITASIVGLVSGSNLLFVCTTGAVGAMCLAISMYLYQQLPSGNDN